MKTRSASWFLAAACLAAAAPAQTFLSGEIWLVGQALDNGAGGFVSGVVRVDAAGTTHLVLSAQSTFEAMSTFDAFRGGLVIALEPLGSPATDVAVVRADGSSVPLGVNGIGLQAIAATGDGRIYLYRPNVSLAVQVLDAANVVHDLLDATGTAPFTLSGSPIDRTMTFEPLTNCLWLGTQASGGLCGVGAPQAAVMRIPLSADGTRVGGTVQTVPICALNASTGTRIENFSDGPGGTVMAVLADNTNDMVGRMVTIDRTTLAATTFASNGPYIGAAATVAGAYSHVLGKAVIADGSSKSLRAYTLGESGGGAFLTTGGASVNADASLLEIPSTVTTGLVPFGTGTPGCSIAQALFATTSPTAGAAGFRFTCTNAPASALGLLLLGNVPDVGGSDPFAFGALLHVNLFLSTFLNGADLHSNAAGFAQSPAPIPISAALVGQTVDAQALWVWSGCATPSPFGISTSTGLAVTFQP